MHHRKVSKDLNHREVVSTLLQLGCPSIDLASLGGGVPDLVVWARTEYILVEVKNPSTRYGRVGLNTNQTKWAEKWKGGPVYVVSSTEHVVAIAQGRKSEVPSYGGGACQLPRGGG